MRRLLWFFGALIFISIVMFFVNPSLFTQRGSMWTEYNDWNSKDLSTITYDLYKPIGHRTVELNDESFMTVMYGEVRIDFYEVTSLEYDGFWPYIGLLESRKSSVDNMKYYGAVAVENDQVIAKNLVYVTEDISAYEKVEENIFLKEYNNGNLVVDISVLKYDDAYESFGWTQETIDFYKNWVYNDLDQEIRVSFSFDVFGDQKEW